MSISVGAADNRCHARYGFALLESAGCFGTCWRRMLFREMLLCSEQATTYAHHDAEHIYRYVGHIPRPVLEIFNQAPVDVALINMRFLRDRVYASVSAGVSVSRASILSDRENTRRQ